MKKNAILFSKVDNEDFWVCGGIVFKVENTATYEDAYNEVKHKLESPEIIDYIVEDRCLLDDLFDGDETYKFIESRWCRGLYLTFKNDSGEEVDYRMFTDFVVVP